MATSMTDQYLANNEKYASGETMHTPAYPGKQPMIRGHCEIIEDPALVATTIRALQETQSGKSETPREAILSAPKRVILKITPEKIASWDHTKLGGKY